MPVFFTIQVYNDTNKNRLYALKTKGDGTLLGSVPILELEQLGKLQEQEYTTEHNEYIKENGDEFLLQTDYPKVYVDG